MLIDWFTIAAQVVNFLILVWLLKRFLYKPILHAIDAREKHIASEMAGADAKRSAAERERSDFQNKNKAFEEQRSALLSKAMDEVKIQREQLLNAARKEADSLREKQSSALRNEQTRMGAEITRLATEEVFGIARKALADLATVSLEERFGEVFTRRLREMDGKNRDLMGAALGNSADPGVLRSALDLPVEQRTAIQNALNETFSAAVRVRFETKKELVSGIEFTVGGQTIGWSIATYLSALDQKVSALVDAQSASEAKSTSITSAENAPALKSLAQAGAK